MTDRILTNCKIYTFNPRQPEAQALAINDGKITALGSREEIMTLADQNTSIDDMQGRCILPGLTDAHIHLLEYGFSLQRIDCETPTRAECLQRVQERAAKTPNNQWVLGHGWNHNVWPEGIGNKDMLDSVSGGRPVYLTHKSLHSGWANSAALEIAGITEESSDPDNGQYQRDENGQLTGILLEGAMRVVENTIPHPDQSTRMDALLAAQQSLLQFGITSVHDFDQWDCYEALNALDKSSQLILRVMKGIPLPELDRAIQSGIHSGSGSSHLTYGWLKLFADGALGPQTAAMLSPYEKSEALGMLFLKKDDVVAIGQKALSHGISMAVHAIGDRANHEVIEGYAQLSKLGLTRTSPLPNRIEHVQLIAEEDIPRLSAFGITASMQPIHAISDRVMADKHWGERCAFAYAWQSVQSSGADLVFGSDAPVESPNPYWGIHAATTRKSLDPHNNKDSWQPHQCLNLNDALRAYITRPQLVSGRSGYLGKLQAGYQADLVIFDSDLFGLENEAIRKVMPAAAMVAGNWVSKQSID